MEYSDWELVREIKNGNEDAMELLVRRYYPQVFRYVLQIIESEHDSYDVTQDIFLSVIQNISSYLPLKKFGSWLFTIAHNKCMDYFKMNFWFMVKIRVFVLFVVKKLKKLKLVEEELIIVLNVKKCNQNDYIFLFLLTFLVII